MLAHFPAVWYIISTTQQCEYFREGVKEMEYEPLLTILVFGAVTALFYHIGLWAFNRWAERKEDE